MFSAVLMVLLGCQAQKSTEASAGILSLIPAFTETIAYLDAEEKLVGRSDYCLNPKPVLSLPAFGSSLTPNLEAIARLRPKHILLDASVGGSGKELSPLGEVVAMPWLTLDEVAESTLRIGELVEQMSAAAKLSEQFRTQLMSTATESAPRVLLMMSGSDVRKGQIWYIRPDSLHGAALNAAGFRNAILEAPDGPPSLSVERLLSLDPDVILFLTTSILDDEAQHALIESLSGLVQLSAVQKSSVGVVNLPNGMGVGPGILRLPQALKQTVSAFQQPSP